MEVKPYEAAFAAEVEGLLQTPIFYDEQRSTQLYEHPEALRPDDLGARRALGSAAIRLIAEERSERRVLARRLNPHLSVKDWNAAQQLTSKYLKDIVHQRYEDVQYIARQLALVNMTEQTLADGQRLTDIYTGLRGRQPDYIKDLLHSVLIGPVKTDYLERYKKHTCFIRGAAAIAPTGYGKTFLMGRLAKALGVGKPLEGLPNDKRALRLLIVEPTQELVNQIAGEEGDGTFEKASGLKAGRYFQYDKNTSTDVVVTTRTKFIEFFRDGKLGEEIFDLLFIDETHILTGHTFRKTVLAHWHGMLFGFTATPQYSPAKDVRHLLPHTIQHEDLITCIENGTLNGAQLFNLVVTPTEADTVATRASIDDEVVKFLTPLLREGRRGIVFCEPGENSVYARQLACKLSKIEKPEHGFVRAEAIGSFNRRSSQTIKAYHKGYIDVLTSVRKGSLGLNGEFDFVIINRGMRSILELKQVIGRGARASDIFPFTVYGQVIVPDRAQASKRNIYEAFDLESIIQGIVIGREGARGKQRLVCIEQFDADVQTLLAQCNHKPVGEVFLMPGREIEIPEGYIPLDELLLSVNLTPNRAKDILAHAGLDWIGRREGGQKVRRYYEPAAKFYLLNHVSQMGNIPFDEAGRQRVSTDGYVSISSIGKEYGFGWKKMRALVAQIDVPLEEKRHTHLNGLYIRREDLPRLKQRIEELVPLPEPGESSVRELSEQFCLQNSAVLFNIMRRRRFQPTRKRRPEGGTDSYYSPEDTAYLKAELAKKLRYPEAPPGAMSQKHLLATLGIADKSLRKAMSAEEKRMARLRWIRMADKQMLMLLPTWTAEEAAAIVQRIQTERAQYPHAVKGKDWGIYDITTATGISAKNLYKKLQPWQRALAIVKYGQSKTGALKLGPYWSEKDALEIIASIIQQREQ